MFDQRRRGYPLSTHWSNFIGFLFLLRNYKWSVRGLNLGKVLGVASSQHLILRTPGWENEKSAPEIGTPVVTIEKERVGTIFDVFGPEDKPFISVKLSNPSQLEKYKQMKGSTLFSMPKKKKTLKRKSNKSGKRTFQKSSPPKKQTFQKSSPPKKRKPAYRSPPKK